MYIYIFCVCVYLYMYYIAKKKHRCAAVYFLGDGTLTMMPFFGEGEGNLEAPKIASCPTTFMGFPGWRLIGNAAGFLGRNQTSSVCWNAGCYGACN